MRPYSQHAAQRLLIARTWPRHATAYVLLEGHGLVLVATGWRRRVADHATVRLMLPTRPGPRAGDVSYGDRTRRRPGSAAGRGQLLSRRLSPPLLSRPDEN
jgi:hypothetical protein